VKYIILQHLPVFLQKDMPGETDAQLVNSVYLDNRALELYHGRLDKTPGAIALRMRWYGTSTPETVFVERKTHRDSWAGEVSVKERFIVNEKLVASILRGEFDLQAEKDRMVAKGKQESDINEYVKLATEVLQVIGSKQLEPTMRTQYMRTAFQIPFDATVRVSLDTNLCMICERSEEVISGTRWYRDPSQSVPKNEITRFPHAVLEIKLQLEGENSTPEWVTELINSGMLMQVHKFSKFIHGCATLMPEDVQALPYWIDDPTLAPSIIASGAEDILKTSTGANQYYQHLIPHDRNGQTKIESRPPIPRSPPALTGRAPSDGNGGDEDAGDGWCGKMFSYDSSSPWWCFEWASEMDDLKTLAPQKVSGRPDPPPLFASSLA
jgi:SPX domain protein involved in polyphosphate accumulation